MLALATQDSLQQGFFARCAASVQGVELYQWQLALNFEWCIDNVFHPRMGVLDLVETDLWPPFLLVKAHRL